MNCWDFPENEETLSVAEDFPEVSPLVWTEFGVTQLKPVFSEEIPAEVRKEIPKKGNSGMREVWRDVGRICFCAVRRIVLLGFRASYVSV